MNVPIGRAAVVSVRGRGRGNGRERRRREEEEGGEKVRRVLVRDLNIVLCAVRILR